MSRPESPPLSPVHPELRRARAVAKLMDRSIPLPGTRRRIGLDPVIGLVPGIGDWVGLAVSLHLIWVGLRLGAPASVLARMVGRALVDALVGAIPVAGDVFDALWRANTRNLALLEAHLADPSRTRRESRRALALVGAATGLAVGALAWGGWLVLEAVLALVGL